MAWWEGRCMSGSHKALSCSCKYAGSFRFIVTNVIQHQSRRPSLNASGSLSATRYSKIIGALTRASPLHFPVGVQFRLSAGCCGLELSTVRSA